MGGAHTRWGTDREADDAGARGAAPSTSPGHRSGPDNKRMITIVLAKSGVQGGAVRDWRRRALTRGLSAETANAGWGQPGSKFHTHPVVEDPGGAGQLCVQLAPNKGPSCGRCF